MNKKVVKVDKKNNGTTKLLVLLLIQVCIIKKNILIFLQHRGKVVHF
jgi:hypothetical protein